MSSKPGITVLSKDGDDGFSWLSNGWHSSKNAHTKQAQDLMTKAKACIDQGNTVPEVMALLRKAGFTVTRQKAKA